MPVPRQLAQFADDRARGAVEEQQQGAGADEQAGQRTGERDFIALIDGVHQLVKAPIVLVRDRLNTHVSHAMGKLIDERAWLTVFLLPAYSPDLNPVEWVWAHIKRNPANLAVVAPDRLEALVRNRLKRLQYRPHALDGFMTGTGLTLDEPASP
ncbi:transposase [Streptomyces sp. NPDC018972]|uniref:transposase n=1 Tax=Streptomyces sp. NPDC018972 TaxID=3365060 RepID=UPI0037B0A23D